MSNELAVSSPSLFPTEQEFKILKEQAEIFVKSGFLPKAVNTSEKAITIALKGRELGLPPLTAFAHIHVIEGKPTMSAELMLAQLYKHIPGFIANFTETSNSACIIKAKRPNGEWAEFAFTEADAQSAGLLMKPVWKQYRKAMLRARCISAMARVMGPDALMGVSYTPEELGADVTPTGDVVALPQQSADKVAKLNSVLGLAKPVVSEVVTVEQLKKEAVAQAQIHEAPTATVVVTEEGAAPSTHQVSLHPEAPVPESWGADLPARVASPAPVEQDDSPGAYVVPIGGNKGKRLDQCEVASIEKTRNFLYAEQTKGSPLSSAAVDFLAASAHYLNWKQGMGMEDVP